MTDYYESVEGSVQISRAEYERLKERDKTLSKLEMGGVDNWEWYGACFEDEDNLDD
jgi:hypothetical protein